MAFCKYCGRELKEGEVCHCRSGKTDGSAPADGRPDSDLYGEETVRNDFDQGAGNGFDSGRGPDRGFYGDPAGEGWRDSVNIDTEKLRQMRDKAISFGQKSAEAFQEARRKEYEAPGGAYERGMPVVDQCIVPMEEEIPVRQYNIAVLRTIFPYKRAEGRLQVTNKRVIFRATGKSMLGSVFYENEFMLENIAGVEIRKGRRVNLWFLFFGLLALAVCGGIGLWLSEAVSGKYWDPSVFALILCLVLTVGGGVLCSVVKRLFLLKAAVFLLAACMPVGYAAKSFHAAWLYVSLVLLIGAIVYWIMFATTDDLVLMIKVAGALNAVEIRRDGGAGMMKKEYSGFAEVLPWKDTEIANREIGALINDVKQYGNDGINKWRQ